MFAKINEKNKRAIGLGIICGGMILLYSFVIEPWQLVRKRIVEKQEKVEQVHAQQALQKAELAAFEMPKPEDEQRLLFERKFSEQLQQCGIQVTTQPYYLHGRGKKQPGLGVKLLRMHCKGKCNFNQAMDLLVKLHENPYLVAVEEFKLECGKKKRQEMKLAITVSTFVADKKSFIPIGYENSWQGQM